MRIVTAIALALALGSAYAQDAAKPAPKPEAKKEQRPGAQHRHGMSRMQGMGGGCHEGQAAEHKHQS